MRSEPVDIWENEVYLAGRYRERMAWRVAFGAILLAIIALVSLEANFSLQHTEYVVVKVDARTGDADITSIVETTSVSTDEVLAEAFVHKYVVARETYDSWIKSAASTKSGRSSLKGAPKTNFSRSTPMKTHSTRSSAMAQARKSASTSSRSRSMIRPQRGFGLKKSLPMDHPNARRISLSRCGFSPTWPARRPESFGARILSPFLWMNTALMRRPLNGGSTRRQ